ncbi:MAG: hypothetical protein JSW65_05575 [Candidatus Bipolaricaulota bacterium]|nr:MAG: hypothetical protein JSW65_05575 [Candidatus Bipolaricaulota bacterium]
MNRLTLETADGLLAETELRRSGRIDLSGVVEFDPYGLLLVALIVAHHRERGTHLPILWPRTHSARTALESMGLHHATGRRGMSDVAPSPDRIPVETIDDEATISAIVGRFDERLLERYPLTAGSRRRLTKVLLELFQNIPHHSNATGEIADPMGRAAMMDSDREIHLAVVDKGIGLRRSLGLRAGFEGISDEDALDRIVFAGVSRHLDPGHGGELRRIAELVRLWDGTLAVRSGEAVLFMDAERGDIYDSPPFPGVQIGLRLPRRVLGVEEAPVDDGPFSGFNEPRDVHS